MAEQNELNNTGASDEKEGNMDDLDKLIEKLKGKFEGKAGNKALRNELGWADSPDRYWNARKRALEQGLIEAGRGRGGSVKIIEFIGDALGAEAPGTAAEEDGNEKPKEADLYEPARKVIEGWWAKAESYDDFIVSVTATRGRAYTGGKWTRPDISILAIKAYPYLPRWNFDIVTFEVKPSNQISVEGIFEALSHQQFANRAYTVFHVPDFQDNDGFVEKYSDGQRILATARKHGIGVILATDINDWETWDEILAADRVSPDPEQANRFIATGFSPETRERVIKWHK